MDRIKKWLFIVGVIPAIIAFWTTFAAVVTNYNTLTEIIEFAQNVDSETGLTGAQQVRKLIKEHVDNPHGGRF